MAAAQRKATVQHKRPQTSNFVAAVRYLDGSRDLFHVLKADDLDDARALVLSEVGAVRSLLITPKH